MTGSWFAQLPNDVQLQLQAIARERSLASGEVLFHRGDSFDGIYLLQRGLILISGVNRQGDEALLTVLEAGAMFGEIALFDGEPRTHDAIAAQECLLWQFPAFALQQLLKQQPGYWQWLGQLLTAKMRQVFAAMEQHTLLDAKARLYWRLLQLCPHNGARLPLSQQQLAQLLGVSRQSTNQLLQTIQRQGVIRLSYGALELLDRERLQALLLQID